MFNLDLEIDDHEEVNMENGALAKVVYKFQSDIDGELSLNIGDVIQVKYSIDRHWYYGTNGFQSGNFPAGFVIEYEIPQIDENQEMFITFENFAAIENGDLGFNKNDVIIGIKEIDSNWWYGEIDGRRGIFPVTHVWKPDLRLIKQKQSNRKIRLKARVKMNMKAQLDEEMDLVKGESVTITEIIDKDWMRGECNGQTGIFPSAYVVLEDNDTTQDANSIVVNPIDRFMQDLNVSENTMHNLNPIAKDTYSSSVPGITPYGRTRFSFVAQFPDELCFRAGEIVTIFRHVDSQWLEGELAGKCGFFPKSHIDIIVDCAMDNIGDTNSSIFEPQVEIIQGITEARVLYDYISQGPEDLNLVEDELITIQKKLNSDWYKAKDCQGNVGLCPANYIVIKPTKTNSAREECNNNKLEKLSPVNPPLETYWDFNKVRSVSDTDALDKSIAKNLANLDLSLCASSKPRSVTFTHISSHKKISSPPPRPNPPIFSKKSVSEVPQRPPPPTISPLLPTIIPPPPPVTPPVRPIGADPSVKAESPTISSILTMIQPPLTIHSHVIPHTIVIPSENVLAPFRPAPPPPFKAINEGSHDQPSLMSLDNTALRVPHRPAPPLPPVVFMSKGTMDSFNGLQRKISERENNLKQLQRSKQELDSHVITRQSSHEAMQDHVRAYQETIDGLTNEISCLKESAKNSTLPNNCDDVELRAKNVEKRKLVITELIKTEQDYVTELKLCRDVFLEFPDLLKAKGIDVDVLFGNLDQIITLGEEILSNFKANSGDADFNNVLIGTCFENIADAMKEGYANYCSNHGDVLNLLEKYQENESVQNLIDQKLNIIREKIPCFSLGSILIKPVQRILKYPLLLNELIKATNDDHPDMIHLQKAMQKMTDVATSINEYKRRKEIVEKYRQDEDTSIAATFSKINFHSLLKKSNRISMRFSSTIGLTSVTKDETFDVEEHKFRVLEKTIKIFIKDVTEFCILLEEWVTGQFHVGEHFASIFAEQCKLPHLDRYRSVVQRELFQVIWKDFKSTITSRVVHPLGDLLHLFHGPMKVIDKRFDKLLDYDSSTKKVEKNKDISKAKQLREEQSEMKKMYEALNTQLIEELPKFFTLSLNLFFDCTVHFFCARKKFIGKLSKEMLSLMDLSAFKTSQGDILEDFETKHANVASELTIFNFIPKNFVFQRVDSLRDKKNKSNVNDSVQTQINTKQTDSDREKITVQYPLPFCYCSIKVFQPSDRFEVPLAIGDVVAVIKQQDPMGGTNRWFIDNGVIKGFVPADCLVPITHTSYGNQGHSSADQSKFLLVHSQPLLQPPISTKQNQVLTVKLPLDPHSQPTEKEDPPPSYYDLPPDDVLDQSYNLPFNNVDNFLEEREVFVAAYDLNSPMPGTLNLTRGENVYMIQVDINPDWFFVENTKGEKGYVPANYLIKR